METIQKTTNLPSIGDLDSADRGQLMARFEAVFGCKPPTRASLALMRQNLAWAIQAKAESIAPRTHRDQLMRKLGRHLTGKKAVATQYRAGTRLVREWRGQLYEVTIQEDGYEWNGRLYPNLTRIATEITGTKWSGPRFFGLD